MKTFHLILCLLAGWMIPLAQPVWAEGYKETMDLARELRLNGDTDGALLLYEGVLAENDDDVDALVGRGYCLIRESERLDEALEDFMKVVTLSPTYIDAHIGAAIIHHRKGDHDVAEAVLLMAEEASQGKPSRLQYLGSSAWREGQYKMARRMDKMYGKEPDRKLVDTPYSLSPRYAHYWLDRGDDWDRVGIGGSYRMRPDWTFAGAYDWHWRYGEHDWVANAGLSYRHDPIQSYRYKYSFSDSPGFLVRQKHRASASFALWPSGGLSAGYSRGNYGGDWSRKFKVGIKQGVENASFGYRFGFGHDTKGKYVTSHSLGLSYSEDQDYAVRLGISYGEETVDFIRAGEIRFRTDDVLTVTFTGSKYLNPTLVFRITGLYEERSRIRFRRGFSMSLAQKF